MILVLTASGAFVRGPPSYLPSLPLPLPLLVAYSSSLALSLSLYLQLQLILLLPCSALPDRRVSHVLQLPLLLHLQICRMMSRCPEGWLNREYLHGYGGKYSTYVEQSTPE